MIVRPGEMPQLEALDWLVLGCAVLAVVLVLREARTPGDEGE
jgi:hypothetical protein